MAQKEWDYETARMGIHIKFELAFSRRKKKLNHNYISAVES